MAAVAEPIIRVKGLKTQFQLEEGIAVAVDEISFEVPAGKTLALVGESGCGKSMTALSIMRLVPDPPGEIVAGEILYKDRDLLKLRPVEMMSIRRHDISMIFQEPMTSLNPVHRVGSQIGEAVVLHKGVSKAEGRNAAIEFLQQVGIPAPEQRVDDYPHQMSGGMRQRVMIAMALASDPDLLIADEPTTALDVTIQAQILDVLRSLQEARGMSILLITHDLGVVAEMADEVAVMYAGKIVHTAPVHDLFENPEHPYTRGLFRSVPQAGHTGKRLETIEGQVPAAIDFPSGCRFHPRCADAMDKCKEQVPPFFSNRPDRHVACWLHEPDNAV